MATPQSCYPSLSERVNLWTSGIDILIARAPTITPPNIQTPSALGLVQIKCPGPSPMIWDVGWLNLDTANLLDVISAIDFIIARNVPSSGPMPPDPDCQILHVKQCGGSLDHYLFTVSCRGPMKQLLPLTDGVAHAVMLHYFYKIAREERELQSSRIGGATRVR